jgi:hypothetical protein
MNNGDVFYDKDRKTLVLYDGQTKSGIPLLRADLENAETGLGVAVSENPPNNSRAGSLWFDVKSGELFIYVDDGDSAQWVQPSSPVFSVSQTITPPYILPTASANVLGGVRVDGTTITISNGVISSSGGSSGITLNSLSAINGNPSGSGDLSYNNSTGAFTFSPPDFTTFLTGYATETFVGTAISNLIDTAPTTLNTLNELAAALGDDANFASTVTTAISGKEPTITAGTTGQYWRGDKSWQTLDATAVGLGNVTNESKTTMFSSPTFTGTTTLQQSTEIINTINGATGTVTHNFSTGAIWYHTNIVDNFTANFTNVPTTTDRAISVVLVLNQGATARLPTAIQIGGAAVTIKWFGEVVPTPSNNKIDIVSFTLLRIGSTWEVLGSLSSGESASQPALQNLSNVTISNVTNGQVLKYNASTAKWVNASDLTGDGGSGIGLGDLSVTVASASGNGTLSYDNSTGIFTFTPPSLSSFITLSSISVEQATTPSGNGSLVYSNSTGVLTFTPPDLSSGGSASNSFTTIAVSGQSNIEADSSTDTLTIVAGTGISITTNASTDTLTIASTVSAGATAFTELSDASTAGLTIDKIYLPAITRLTVTANGSSAYLFDQYTGNNPTIYAISGTTIAFDLGTGALGAHPFLIRFSGANYDTGLVHVTSSGTVTTGTSAQGKTSGTLYWKIPAGVSGAYGYLCASHGAMIGTITVKDISAI